MTNTTTLDRMFQKLEELRNLHSCRSNTEAQDEALEKRMDDLAHRIQVAEQDGGVRPPRS